VQICDESGKDYASDYEAVIDLLPVKPHQIIPDDFKLIFNIWNALRGERMAPTWPEIDLMKFPFERISRCAVVDFDAAAGDFNYRFWGSEITDLHNQELSGKSILTLKPRDVAEHVVIQYYRTMEAKAPGLFINHLTSAYGVRIEEIALRLPLSSDGLGVDQFLCVFDFSKDLGGYQARLGETNI